MQNTKNELMDILKEILNRLGSVENRLGSVETEVKRNGIRLDCVESDIKALSEQSNAHFEKIEGILESLDNTKEQVAENALKIYALENNPK